MKLRSTTFKIITISALLISVTATGAPAPASKQGARKLSPPPDSKAILVEGYTGDPAAFVADEDASTAQVVILSDKKQGESRVTDDGQVVFVRNGEKTTKVEELLGESLANRWLVGTWVLCHDADASPRDSIQFKPGRKGSLQRPDQSIDVSYGIKSDRVSLLFKVNGSPAFLFLQASPDRDKLLAPNLKTGNTMTYVRTDGKLVSGCSVK